MANNNIEERGDSGESDQRSPSGNAVQGIQIPWDGPRFLHHAGNPALPETDVMELIRQQARRTPLAAAVETDGGHVWNYRELGFRVCALAQRLDEEAPVPAESDASGLRCGSLSKGGAEGLMCILGVLYAGRCLLPLDIKCPDSRLSYLVEDAKLRVAVVDSNSFGIDHARDLGIRMIVEVTDIASPQWKRQRCELDWLSRSNVPVRRIGEAYMNYTSGTTGKPKSIVSMHRSVLSHSLAAAKVLDARQQDCCLFQSPPMYGFHMCQLYPYLQIGARVALPLTSVSQTPLRIWEGPPTKAGVSVAAFVPSVLDPQLGGAAMHIPKSVRRIKCSGEALGGATVSSTIALHKNLSMVNWWGNTECLGCTAVLMEPSAAKWLTEGAKGLPEVSGRCPPISQAVPVGLPVGWRTLHLLPAEVAGKMLRKDEGEACVTGPAVCPPYAGRPKEAAAAFADSAFGPGNVLRTGDILLRSEVPEAFAPYSLRYVGRKDFQIKINGIRIELGEIEEVAMELQAVERCIVKLHASELDGQLVKQLVAFYVGKEVREADVQAHIAQKVPKAMVPHQVVFLKEFPSNNASKIDRAALIPPAVKQKGLAVMDSLGLQRVIASRDEVWAHHATQAMYSLVPFCLLYAHWLPFNLSDVTAETDTHVLDFLQFLHHIRILNVASLFMGMSDKTARKSYSPIKSFFMVAFLYFYQAWPRIVPGAGGFATLHRWTFLAILIYKVLIFCLERIRVPMPRACLSPRISNICARVGWNALQQQKGSVLWFPVPPSLVVFVVACIAPIWGSVPLNMWEGHGAVSIWPERLTSNAKRLTDGDQMLPYIEKAFYGSPNGTLGSWIVLFANYFAGFHYGVPFYCKHREMMTNLENRGRAHVIAVRTAAFVAAAGLAWMRELVDVPVLPAFERFNVSMTMWDWPNYFDGFYPLRFLAEWLFALLLTTALADGAWAWNLVGRNLLFTYLGHMIVMFDMPALLDALAPAGVIVQFLVILMLPYMYSLSVGALLFEVVAQCSIFLSKRRLLSRLITGLLVAVWLGLVLGALYVNRT